MPSTRLRLLPATLLLVAAPAASAGAQPLVTARDAAVFGALAGSAAALMPLDARIRDAFRASGPQGSAALHDAARVFNTAGDPGALVGSVALFGVGRLAGRPDVARLGLHTTEAIVLGGSATAALKLVAGRKRPYASGGDSHAFAFLRGTDEGRSSFPSGHTTAAFALASALASDLRANHARGANVWSPLLYGGATLVGAARMYDDKHWASDVAFGAAMGTLAGRVVTHWSRAHPNSWLEGLAGH